MITTFLWLLLFAFIGFIVFLLVVAIIFRDEDTSGGELFFWVLITIGVIVFDLTILVEKVIK